MPARDDTGLLYAILAERAKPAAPPPVYRYVVAPPPKQRSIDRVIEVVARTCSVSVDAIKGHQRDHLICNVRSAIAVLSAEFAPRQSLVGVDDAMRRGEGTTYYYRERHADRCALWPEYQRLYRRCRAELLVAV